METTKIPQFTGVDFIEVQGDNHATCGKLVRIFQRSASLSFQFDMTPDQALDLAASLQKYAYMLKAQS